MGDVRQTNKVLKQTARISARTWMIQLFFNFNQVVFDDFFTLVLKNDDTVMIFCNDL